MTYRRPFTEEDDRVLIACVPREPIHGIALALGRCDEAVAKRADELERWGRLRRPRRKRQWTEEEEHILASRADKDPIATIARALGRPVSACRAHLCDRGVAISKVQVSGRVMTGNEVAALLGVETYHVDVWRRGGLIASVRVGQCGGHYRIPEPALYRFMRESTHLYQPADMPIGPWRSYAERCHQRHPVPRYVSVKRLAALRGCGDTTVQGAIYRGDLPAIRLPGCGKQWFILEADAARWEPQLKYSWNAERRRKAA